MNNLADSYRQHAASARAQAEETPLENVRERNLRAAHAWTQMAERQERTDRARALREAPPVAAE